MRTKVANKRRRVDAVAPVDAPVAPVDADAVPSPVDASVAPVDASVPATELTNDAKWLRLHRDFPNRVLGPRAVIFFLGMIDLHESLTAKFSTPRLQLVVDNINMQMESPSNHLGILSELLDSPYLATLKMLRAIPALHALFAALDATKDVRSDEVVIEWDRLKMPVQWALYQAIFRETNFVYPHCGREKMTV